MDQRKSFVATTFVREDRSAKRRRKIKLWVGLPLFIISFCLAASFALWKMGPGAKGAVLVVDKTVPHSDYREHQALFWVLNHIKASKRDGSKLWKPDKDYVGFYPKKFTSSDASFSSDIQQAHLEGIDCLFLADTYGVYIDDFLYPERNRTHLDYSQKIYGGLTADEVDAVERFVGAGGSLVAEFNTFYQPTTGSQGERMEGLLGLQSTGWKGRYFTDLSNMQDVPSWVIRDWEELQNKAWEFRGPGFILAHSDTKLLVLVEGVDVEPAGLKIEREIPDDALMKGVSSLVPYPYWFDIVMPEDGTDVLASYSFQLRPGGREKMKAFSLPETFPAVLRASRSPLRMYFAGDFSDSQIYRGPYFFCGWSSIRRFLCSFRKDQSYDRFFWSFYVPLLKNLFKGAVG